MKLLFELDVEKLEAAQSLYKCGKYQLAPRVVFLRALLDDIIARNKKILVLGLKKTGEKK